MFRSAKEIESQATGDRLERLRQQWVATRDTWFDGSVESVDRRIAHLNQAMAIAQNAAVSGNNTGLAHYALATLPAFRAQREDMVATRGALRATLPGEPSSVVSEPGRMSDAFDRINQGQPIDTVSDLEREYQYRTEQAREHAGRPGPDHDYDPRMGPSHPSSGYDDSEFDARTQDARDYASAQEQAYGPYQDEPLRQAARDFVVDNQGLDRDEMLYQAGQRVAEQTMSWTKNSSAAAVRDFVAAVGAATPRKFPTRVAYKGVEDFDDYLMFG